MGTKAGGRQTEKQDAQAEIGSENMDDTITKSMHKKKKKLKGKQKMTPSKHGFLTLLVCLDPKDMALRVDARDVRLSASVDLQGGGVAYESLWVCRCSGHATRKDRKPC